MYMRSARRPLWRGWLSVGLLVCLVGVAACGGSSNSSSTSGSTAGSGSTSTSTSSSGGSSGAISASTLSALQAKVQKAEQPPTFTAPGPAVSASVLKGASLTVFPVNSEIDACQTQATDFAALGQQLGAHVTLISNSGQPPQWQSAVGDAVAGHDKAVAMLCGVIPGVIGPQLSAARNAGVIVVDGNYNDTSNYAGLDGETAVQTTQSLQNDVDDAIVNLKGKPLHAIFLNSDSIIQGPAASAAVHAEVSRVCPSTCTVTDITVPIQSWATAIQSNLASALVSHSDTNAVIIAFDGMTQFALPAVVSSHIGNLHIYTWGGGRPVEKLMQQSNPIVVADPGPDEQWDAYEAMDQVIRVAGHHPPAPVNQEVDPDRFWVPSNVSSFFGPGGTYGNGGFGGNAFITGFDKLWGIS